MESISSLKVMPFEGVQRHNVATQLFAIGEMHVMPCVEPDFSFVLVIHEYPVIHPDD